ncbi:hypothetical protein GCM10009016_17290 [Halomonas beimenensis]
MSLLGYCRRGSSAAGLREGAVNPSLGATFALRRYRFLRRLQGLGWPSMANPLGGKNIHWTFFSIRLAPGQKTLTATCRRRPVELGWPIT